MMSKKILNIMMETKFEENNNISHFFFQSEICKMISSLNTFMKFHHNNNFTIISLRKNNWNSFVLIFATKSLNELCIRALQVIKNNWNSLRNELDKLFKYHSKLEISKIQFSNMQYFLHFQL